MLHSSSATYQSNFVHSACKSDIACSAYKSDLLYIYSMCVTALLWDLQLACYTQVRPEKTGHVHWRETALKFLYALFNKIIIMVVVSQSYSKCGFEKTALGYYVA